MAHLIAVTIAAAFQLILLLLVWWWRWLLRLLRRLLLLLFRAEEVLLELGAELEVLDHRPRQLPQLLPDRILAGLSYHTNPTADTRKEADISPVR